MTLTVRDVKRLERAGCRDFLRRTAGGELQLVNLDGRCLFLDRGRCEIYPFRPEGCRLYPLVLDLADGRVVKDTDCPHHREFELNEDAADRLRRSVAREAVEARMRLRTHDG
jgi:Fe-S-cluster containining protein